MEWFCDDGVINWDRLVQANSGNYDLDRHGFTFEEGDEEEETKE